VLEQIARTTEAALQRIDARLDRIETRQADDFRLLSARHDRDFRWLLAVMLSGIAVNIGGFVSLLIAVLHR
jgi:hypothetical protein